MGVKFFFQNFGKISVNIGTDIDFDIGEFAVQIEIISYKYREISVEILVKNGKGEYNG